MILRVLGTAAGGGVPQWNCNCPNCRDARLGRQPRRLQSALAISPDGAAWYLVNATPDVREQLDRMPAAFPGPGIRESPLRGVLLTDAELDHTVGLLYLREGARWRLYATGAVLDVLETAFPVLPILRAYSPLLTVQEVSPGGSFTIEGARRAIRVHVTAMSDRLPLYAGSGRRHAARGEAPPAPGAVVALTFEDLHSGRKALYAPGVRRLTPALEREVRQADLVLLDGTFWSEEELRTLGVSARTASDMDHLPMGGPSGTANWLQRLPGPVRRFVHVNNTNPALDPHSPERRLLREMGLDIAEDGWEVEL